MAQDDIVGLHIVGRFQGQNISQTIHYKMMTQVSSDNTILGLLAASFETTHKSSWLAIHNVAYSLMGIRGFSLTGDNKTPGLVHIDEPGTVTGAAAPSPLCKVITLYTGSDNYRRRGRLMFSGGTVPEFDVDDGAVEDTTLGLLASFGANLITALSFSGNEAQPGLAPTDLLPFEPFIDVLARRTPALIRSRRIRNFMIG